MQVVVEQVQVLVPLLQGWGEWVVAGQGIGTQGAGLLGLPIRVEAGEAALVQEHQVAQEDQA
jgi:hypothetical protein